MGKVEQEPRPFGSSVIQEDIGSMVSDGKPRLFNPEDFETFRQKFLTETSMQEFILDIAFSTAPIGEITKGYGLKPVDGRRKRDAMGRNREEIAVLAIGAGIMLPDNIQTKGGEGKLNTLSDDQQRALGGYVGGILEGEKRAFAAIQLGTETDDFATGFRGIFRLLEVDTIHEVILLLLKKGGVGEVERFVARSKQKQTADAQEIFPQSENPDNRKSIQVPQSRARNRGPSVSKTASEDLLGENERTFVRIPELDPDAMEKLARMSIAQIYNELRDDRYVIDQTLERMLKVAYHGMRGNIGIYDEADDVARGEVVSIARFFHNGYKRYSLGNTLFGEIYDTILDRIKGNAKYNVVGAVKTGVKKDKQQQQ